LASIHKSTYFDPEVRVGRIERPAPYVQSGKVCSLRIAGGRPFARCACADISADVAADCNRYRVAAVEPGVKANADACYATSFPAG